MILFLMKNLINNKPILALLFLISSPLFSMQQETFPCIKPPKAKSAASNATWSYSPSPQEKKVESESNSGPNGEASEEVLRRQEKDREYIQRQKDRVKDLENNNKKLEELLKELKQEHLRMLSLTIESSHRRRKNLETDVLTVTSLTSEIADLITSYSIHEEPISAAGAYSSQYYPNKPIAPNNA